MMLRASLLGLLALTAPARADYAAVEFTSPTIDYTNGSWSLGWKFQATSNVIVSALGFYDDKGNGLTESHQVGIFKEDGTLVASTTVNPGDPEIGHFVYHQVPGIGLQAGQYYRIAAVTGDENYTFWPTGFHSNPGIKYTYDSYYYPSGTTQLLFPDQSLGFNAGNAGFFGPNFLLSGSARGNGLGTPEPGSLTLLCLGLAGLGGYVWRRRAIGAM
jgi:hypothetical protein